MTKLRFVGPSDQYYPGMDNADFDSPDQVEVNNRLKTGWWVVDTGSVPPLVGTELPLLDYTGQFYEEEQVQIITEGNV